MIGGKLIIRTNIELHIKLKQLAYAKHLSLNQMCIEMLEKGIYESKVNFDVSELKNNKNKHENQLQQHNQNLHFCVETEDFFEKIKSQFTQHGLIVILKTEGYVADIVLLFAPKKDVPLDLYPIIDEIINQSTNSTSLKKLLIQGIAFISAKEPPNNMWIEIAKNQSIIWSIDSKIDSEIKLLFDEWNNFI